MKGKITSSLSPTLMASIMIPSFCTCAQARFMEGSSSRQGGHQVAQKFTMTGRPR